MGWESGRLLPTPATTHHQAICAQVFLYLEFTIVGLAILGIGKKRHFRGGNAIDNVHGMHAGEQKVPLSLSFTLQRGGEGAGTTCSETLG